MRLIYRCIIIYIVLSFTGCSMKISHVDNSKFEDYINENKKQMVADGIIIKDRQFKLKVPHGMKGSQTVVEGSFTHILHFSDNEKIVIINIPERNRHPAVVNKMNISKERFTKLLDNEDILWIIEDKFPLSKERRFGIYIPEGGQSYVIYLNINRNDVASFDYSIGSIEFD